TPALPSAKSTTPPRHGRPAVSETMRPSGWSSGQERRRRRSRRRLAARASEPRGRSRTPPSPPTFDSSTPAAAMTGPAAASTMRVTLSPARRSATTRTVSAAIASSREVWTRSPSALARILLATTTTSPGASEIPERTRASCRSCPRSSPARTSGTPGTARTVNDGGVAEAPGEMPAAPPEVLPAEVTSEGTSLVTRESALPGQGEGEIEGRVRDPRRLLDRGHEQRLVIDGDRGAAQGHPGIGGGDEPAAEEVGVEPRNRRRGWLDG